MHEVSDYAIVVNRRTGIDDASSADFRARIDDRPGHNDRSVSNDRILGNHSVWMNKYWKMAIAVRIHEVLSYLSVPNGDEQISVKFCRHAVRTRYPKPGALGNSQVIVQEHNFFIAI